MRKRAQAARMLKSYLAEPGSIHFPQPTATGLFLYPQAVTICDLHGWRGQVVLWARSWITPLVPSASLNWEVMGDIAGVHASGTQILEASPLKKYMSLSLRWTVLTSPLNHYIGQYQCPKARRAILEEPASAPETQSFAL